MGATEHDDSLPPSASVESDQAAPLQAGDIVVFLWGLDEVRRVVAEVYGSGPRAMVVVELTPETSGYVVDGPTTVALPLDSVHRPVAA